MPTPLPKKLHRFWCKTCQDFTRHAVEKELRCLTCSTTTEGYDFAEVPKEKLEEQRQRYKEKRQLNTKQLLDSFYMAAAMGGLPPENPGTIKVATECDAGQKEIEELRERDKAIAKNILIKEVNKYKGLGRNKVCVCGSNKKYKKCCLNRIDETIQNLKSGNF